MTKPPSPRPLSVKIISITDVVLSPLYIVVGLFGIKSLRYLLADLGVRETDSLVFGLSMLLVYAYNLFFLGVVGPSLGIGLWRMSERVRWAAIVYHAYWILSYLLAYYFSRVPVYVLPAWGRNAHQQQLRSLTIVAIPVLVHLAALWFLIVRRAAFGKPRTTP